ncbi:MAG: hypothetical protein J6Q64_00735 [Clostridia bacterium]|nr:hypothetical protein [Clostridia bacterium]
MIFKILGCTVAIAASVIAAGAVVSAEKRRVSQLQGFTDLVERIGQQIENFNTPVSQILKSTDPALLHQCGAQSPVTESLAAFLDSCDLTLSEEEKRVLFTFAADLGRRFRSEQIRSCVLCSKLLSDFANDAQILFPNKRKVTYTLFICAALALVIILI